MDVNPPIGPAPRLLLVEDNDGDVLLMKHFLKASGFAGQLQRVKDGVEALDYVYQQGNFSQADRPDVMLLDLGLPKISGHEVLQAIRKDDRFRDLPIIVLSTSKMENDVYKCMELGANSFLTKPADLAELEALVKRLLTVEFPNLVKPAVTH